LDEMIRRKIAPECRKSAEDERDVTLRMAKHQAPVA
jgi:hypothetical protein